MDVAEDEHAVKLLAVLPEATTAVSANELAAASAPLMINNDRIRDRTTSMKVAGSKLT